MTTKTRIETHYEVDRLTGSGDAVTYDAAPARFSLALAQKYVDSMDEVLRPYTFIMQVTTQTTTTTDPRGLVTHVVKQTTRMVVG